MPEKDVVAALMSPAEATKPEEWITHLKNELKDPELMATPLGQEIKGLKGKRFSEVANVFQVRFGIEINSPAELIIALWIYKDRQKGITLKNPAPTFSEMLGGLSIKEAISRARLLLRGYSPC